MEFEVIARIRTPFREKFGLPRQSGISPKLKGEIRFEKKYAENSAVAGLEGFDRIWVLWEFEGVKKPGDGAFRPKVRPPRLGGNEYVGVFATRSPYRPNPIGLSCLKLESVELTDEGPVLHVSGVDMRDGTPIYDIKPYLPYSEAYPDARGGFTDEVKGYGLEVSLSDEIREKALAEGLSDDDLGAVCEILSQDPRPAYHDDPGRIYGMNYEGYEIKFRVENGKAIVSDVFFEGEKEWQEKRQ